MGSPPHTLKNHKNIVFLSNTGPEHMENHKSAKQAINVWPSLARLQWYLDPLITLEIEKALSNLNPL